ncbi:5-formyltetrahydrofolate cyclo-ligase [Pontiella desulfatans]|uniref:5-formyltetrahydrofolate cyclo-ligase n=2 Tax=Pontiella desulfatans TaxID=2750659 RepID=A0A6C2TYQ5_PONDE|nr:5-formyltetrahydrofolate cyclo-ligase [Pontiella desulfatans]
MTARRKALDPRWVADASGRIVECILSLEAFRVAESVAFYKAIGGEVILEPLFSECWKLRKRTCIPTFNPDLKIYEMAEITAATHFESGHYGIHEPIGVELVSVEEIDLMVVPGVAFDPKGNRLGRGGGYYDRLLDGFPGISVAVAFDFQVFDEIPHTAHDIPVNFVVTETKIVEVQNEH